MTKLMLSTINQTINIVFFALFLCISACTDQHNKTPEQLIASAAESFSEGKLNEAVIQLKKALQLKSHLPEARFILGEIYLEMGNGTLAEREFNSAYAQDYTHPDMHVNRLTALLYQGKADEVFVQVEKLIEESGASTDPRLYVIRGDALLIQKNRDAAKQSYESGLMLDAHLPQAYVGLSKIAIEKNNNTVAAKKILDDAMEKGIVDSRIYLAQGIIAYIQRDIEQTESYFSKTLELAPFNRQAMVGVIRARLALGMLDEAQEVLSQLAKLSPDSAAVNYFKAFIAFQKTDYAESKPLLLGILKRIPDHPESLLLLSNILYLESELEQVIEYMERFNTDFPFHLPAAKLLAASYIRQGSSEEAVKVLEKLLNKVQPDAQFYSLLGTAYLRAGKAEQGTHILEKASKLNPDAAEIRTQLALSHIISGATDMAIAELETAVDLNPNLMSADIMLIMAHINKKDFDDAILAAENLRKKDPKNPIAYNLLGNAYSGKQDFSTAVKYFKKALEVKKDFTPARFNLARIYLRDEKFDEAEIQYRSVLEVDKNSAQALIGIAQILAKRQDNVGMQDYLEQARLADARSLQARILLIRFYQATGDTTHLMKVAKEAKALAPNNAEVIYQYARALRLNGQTEQALLELKQIAAQYPEDTTVSLELAKALLDKGDLTQTSTLLNQILNKEPENSQALLTLIHLMIRQSNVDKAKEYLAVYEKMNPGSVEALVSKGDIAMVAKDHLAANDYYIQAFGQSPSRLILYRLVASFRENSDPASAQTYVNQWLAQYPNDNEIRLLQAELSQQLNEFDEAVQLYKVLVENDEKNFIALNNLAWVYFQQGKAGAIDYAEKAYAIAPNSPEVMDTLAWILLKQNKIERALGLLSQAIGIAPNSAAIRYHYAVALHLSGNHESAKEQLETALAGNTVFAEKVDAEKLLNSL